MQSNNTILSIYFSSLSNHITDLTIFHNQTEQLLNSTEISNLYHEDLAKQVVKGSLGYKEPSNVEKILAILKEIAKDSKTHLDRLSRLAPVFSNLILAVKAAK